MPTERLSMRHIREVLRLHYSVGLSQRAVARSLGLAGREGDVANVVLTAIGHNLRLVLAWLGLLLRLILLVLRRALALAPTFKSAS